MKEEDCIKNFVFTKLSHSVIYIFIWHYSFTQRSLYYKNDDQLPQYIENLNYLKNSFFPSTLIEWSRLDLNIRHSESFTSCKGNTLKFIRHFNSAFLCNNPKEIQLLTTLRLGLCNLREYKFKHNFQDTLNPICNCDEDIETSCHTFFTVDYTNQGLTLLNVIWGIVWWQYIFM